MENKVKTPFLDFYFSCMETGRMPGDGICCSFSGEEKEILLIMAPDTIEKHDLYVQNKSFLYWASGLGMTDPLKDRWYSFTPLRQTIVLLAAMINGETKQKRHGK